MSRRVAPISVALGAIFAMAALDPLGAEPLAPASIVGHYRVQGSEMIIAIADCETGLCGRVVGLGKLPKLVDMCGGCQAVTLEPREQLCGAAVVTELHPTEAGWQGRFHDPESRGDYTLLLWTQSGAQGAAPGTGLLVERYKGPPLLSRTLPKLEGWTRVAPPAAACGAATPTS